MADFPLKERIPAIESSLKGYLRRRDVEYAEVFDAMRYASLSGGKRVRPSLLLEIYETLGGVEDVAMPFACALEMIHTYSLIHDDLPCMDDDDFRRGKPSLHKAFSEATALLAGDALLTLAFEVAAECTVLPPSRVLRAVALLAEEAGADGMIGGQVMDINRMGLPCDPGFIEKRNRLKTGALFHLCGEIPLELTATGDFRKPLIQVYCDKTGLLFQAVDDILDRDNITTGGADMSNVAAELCGEAKAIGERLGNAKLAMLPDYFLSRKR